MKNLVFNEATITGSIYKYIFDVLSKNPSGIQWKELDSLIQAEFPDYHPKTINGCIWKLTDKYADYVHKPEKGRVPAASMIALSSEYSIFLVCRSGYIPVRVEASLICKGSQPHFICPREG